MHELLALIKERLALNENLVLVTITESSGSVPRGAGARMLVGRSGASGDRLWGSIGGGLTEHLAIVEAGRLLEEWKPPENGFVPDGKKNHDGATTHKTYMLRPMEAAEQGAACGGDITVSFRVIGSGEEDFINVLEKEMAPDGLVYIFGGGHIARELAPLLARLDFRCVVFDDREEFSRPDLFPGAEKVMLGDFTNIGKDITLGERDYAVIITRGHLWDLEAWAFALKSPAAYIGVIGSKSKHGYVKERLLERGFDPGEISAPRVHAPIGLAIKSETPAELAVSIAGELILVRAELSLALSSPVFAKPGLC